MIYGDLFEYKNSIKNKLKLIERKLELSLFNNKNNQERLASVGHDLQILRAMITKLENNDLTWDDLSKIGISRNSIVELQKKDDRTINRQHIDDFSLLSGIPITPLEPGKSSEFLNELYSIMEHLNQNYQLLFTQKILLMSSKTNTLRERFYLIYQEITRIFKNYSSLLTMEKRTNDLETLIQKEHINLIIKIYTLFEAILEYLEIINSDTTFTQEDFATIIKAGQGSSVNGLSLETALAEFSHFVNEVLDYIKLYEKDIIDSLSLEKR